MEKLKYFDYQKVAGEMKIPDILMKQIENEIEKEFPNDRMMYELHVLRALRSKYWQKKEKNQKNEVQIQPVCVHTSTGRLPDEIKAVR